MELELVRYFPKYDLALPIHLENSKSLLSNVLKDEYSLDINDIVSLSNILRYMDDGLEKQLDNPNQGDLKNIIINYCKSHGFKEILCQFENLLVLLEKDFWHFFVTFGLQKQIEDKEFRSFLFSRQPNIHPILIHKNLLKQFPESLREFFLSDSHNVNYFLKEISFIPSLVTNEDKHSLISNYISSENPSYSKLEIISMMKEINLRIRLLAKRRAEEVKTQLFSSASFFKFGAEISYNEQDEAVDIEYVDGITKYSYDINWILKNTDKATLLNNFIYLFGFVDESCRMTLCFELSELGVFERSSLPERKDLHPETTVFINKNQAALLQLLSYSKILNSVDTSIEELINWFFEEYLKNEFGIKNYQADIPVGEYSYINKCKLLAPEIERILRQYQLLVEDGCIDHDLIALETNAFAPSNTGSLLEQKYCYLQSKDGELALNYFYSDQCMLSYDSRTQKSYETFANRLAQHKLCKNDFEEYQKAELNWLQEKEYLRFDKEGFIVANVQNIVFLGEIFRNGYVCYNLYKGARKAVLDRMISDGTLRIESSLFSKPESDYIDYHLNKRRYINGLDLRNKYAHGSHSGAVDGSGEKEHEINYYQMLKIMVCIVLKINDELCRKEELAD